MILVRSTFDWPNSFMTLGPTRRPMTRPMIASTIMISSRVMPPWRRRRARRPARRGRDFLAAMDSDMTTSPLAGPERAHIHDRLEDREHDERDGAAHDDQHQGLEDGGEAGQLDVDLALVGVGDAREHLLE